MDLTAVGVPVVTGPAQGWNFWPLIGIPLALLVAFRWLRLPRRAGVALTAILVGLLIADAVAAWGVLPVAAGTAALVTGSAIAVGRLRRRHPPTV
jgi:uncharacterized membrane protein